MKIDFVKSPVGPITYVLPRVKLNKHEWKNRESLPKVCLGRKADSDCVYRIDEVQNHDGHAPPWYDKELCDGTTGVSPDKSAVHMQGYVNRIKADIKTAMESWYAEHPMVDAADAEPYVPEVPAGEIGAANPEMN